MNGRMGMAALIILGAALLNACTTEDDSKPTAPETRPEAGVIRIKLASDRFDAGPFYLYTQPSGKTAWSFSDSTGALTEVAAGRYDIYAATLSGATKAFVIVRGGDTLDIDMDATGIGVGPVLSVRHINQAIYQVGDTAEFELSRFDTFDSDSAVSVELFLPGGPGDSLSIAGPGKARVRVGPLALSDTLVLVRASYPGGLTRLTAARIYIDTLPRQAAPAIRREGQAVHFTWHRYTGDGFKSYQVLLRPDGAPVPEILHETFDIEDTVFSDTAPTLFAEMGYSIRVNTLEGRYAESPMSTVVQDGAGAFTASGGSLLHPSLPFVYTTTSSANAGFLYRFDYEALRLDSTRIPETTGFMDIGDNGFGVEVYLPVRGDRVLIVNAQSMDTVASINAFSNVRSVTSDGRGHLMVSARTPISVMTVDRRTLAITATSRLSYELRLRNLPGGSSAIGLALDLSPVYAFRIDPAAPGMPLAAYEYPGIRNFILDPYLFELAPDGSSLISGSAGIIRRLDSSFSSLGELLPDSLGYAAYAFSATGDRLYAALKGRRSIRVFSYPSLAPVKDIPTRGLSRKLAVRGGKLLSVSSSAANPWRCFMESHEP